MMKLRIAVDTGGTFTDAVVADHEGCLNFDKALTTPERASLGTLEALALISNQLGIELRALLGNADLLIYATTRATNAILTAETARTAFLTTEGLPDVLTLREGGKLDSFDFTTPFPDPYVPRSLTFEVPERIDAQGTVVRPLDEGSVRRHATQLRKAGCEAAAVCLVWSIVNADHELAVGRILEEECPGMPYTLSHQLNPIIREYRRASSAAIDASLKPLMQEHFRDFADDLEHEGFVGELLAVTSVGGCLHVGDIIERPIYSIDSGPSMAPIGARTYSVAEAESHDIVVCDTGGTSFDVSLIQDGSIATTREKWLGPEFQGHLTGLSSVAVTSIGAGGGSIGWVDEGGLLCVGPSSAGANPGPACYGRGGKQATVTDAAVLLGYVDPDFFLGGRMVLDVEAATRAVGTTIAEPLGLTVESAADAMLTIANEAMVSAIGEITINQGVDPRECLMVVGGGAGGINAAAIAETLGCARVLIPRTAAALSATGAQFADIVSEFSVSRVMDTTDFDYTLCNRVLADIDQRMDLFASRLGDRSTVVTEVRRQFFLEARYPNQVWELEVELSGDRIESDDALTSVIERFHDVHERTFAVKQPDQPLECQHWKGRLTAELLKPALLAAGPGPDEPQDRIRRVYFDDAGWIDTHCFIGAAASPGFVIEGPAILEEQTTTIVVPPGATATVTSLGNYLVEIGV